MELIPILSTIILVATISTFLLAIGAYILYKIRENRGENYVTSGPTEVRAELVTPVAEPVAIQERVVEKVQPVYVQQPVASSGPQQQPQPIFVQQPNANTMQPQFNVGAPATQFNRTGFNSMQQNSRDSKFMKYTTEGYVSAKQNVNSGALKWK